LTLAAFSLSTRPRRLADLVVTAGALHLSLVSNRHIPMFALAVTPILAEHAAGALSRLRPALPRHTASSLAGGMALYLGVALCLQLPRLPRGDWFRACGMVDSFPARACDFLDRQSSSGPLFHDLVWGGYLIWRYDGKLPVFVDGRNEIFFQTSFPDFKRVLWCERDTQEILDRWKIETMLIMRYQMLETWLRRSPAWAVAYEDDVAIVFRRRDRLARG
jgi:hypothetical protein